jgi:hypothetical protein
MLIAVLAYGSEKATPTLPDPSTSGDDELKDVLKALVQNRREEVGKLKDAEVQRVLGANASGGRVSRSINQKNYPLDSAVRDWVLKIGERSTVASSPDWEVVEMCASLLLSDDQSNRGTKFAKKILELPLPTQTASPNPQDIMHTSSIQGAIAILVSARTRDAQDVLLKIALAPTHGSKGILPSSAGTDDRSAVRLDLMRKVLNMVLWNYPQDRVLPFVKTVAKQYDSTTELGREMAEYLGYAKRVAEGQDPYNRKISPPRDSR